MEKLYTVQEIADQLKIKKNTVYELIKRGELNSTKIGKQIRVNASQLADYLQFPQTAASAAAEEAIPSSDSSILKRDYLLNSSGLIISGQESSVIEVLRSLLTTTPNGIPMLHSYMNSYNSLYSLYFEKVHLALVSSSLDIPKLVPGMPVVVLHICDYQEGYFVQKGNPKNIAGISDLFNPSVRLVNREKGNGCRILLDTLISAQHLSALQINGYSKELLSHMAVASAIANGQADVGIGDQAVLNAFPQLEFLALRQSRMDLVFSKANWETPAFRAILNVVQSDDFKESLQSFWGYSTLETGNLQILEGF